MMRGLGYFASLLLVTTALTAQSVTVTVPVGSTTSPGSVAAGGVAFDAVDEDLMLTARANVFVAGEMLDWEAPTGGYLLQASFATGVAAARGVLKRLGG